MSTKVFFNRPIRPINLAPLWHDMKTTKEHLVLASAWFTDTDTASAFIDSVAECKTVIFNAADMDRGTKRAYELIKSYFNNPVRWNDEEDSLYTGVDFDRYGVDASVYTPEEAIYRFVVLGSGNWQEGVMHHKFILCDKAVWLGSFNFTYQARKNYETLVRIDDEQTIRDFYNEVNDLIFEPSVYHMDIIRNGVFRCQVCTKFLPEKEIGHVDHSGYQADSTGICKKCWTEQVQRVRRKFGDKAADDLLESRGHYDA